MVKNKKITTHGINMALYEEHERDNFFALLNRKSIKSVSLGN